MSTTENPELQKIFLQIEGYFDEALENMSKETYLKAMNGFDALVHDFNRSSNRDVCMEILKLKEKPGRESFKMGIDSLYDKIDKNNIVFRSCLTGVSVEQLEREEREAKERYRKQQETWRTQGLCEKCGGQIGLFKKCKNCGHKN